MKSTCPSRPIPLADGKSGGIEPVFSNVCTRSISIKVGSKGRHVKIPDGFHKVTKGKCLKTDWFVDLLHISFRPVETDDVGMDAETFDHLYRKS